MRQRLKLNVSPPALSTPEGSERKPWRCRGRGACPGQFLQRRGRERGRRRCCLSVFSAAGEPRVEWSADCNSNRLTPVAEAKQMRWLAERTMHKTTAQPMLAWAGLSSKQMAFFFFFLRGQTDGVECDIKHFRIFDFAQVEPNFLFGIWNMRSRSLQFPQTYLQVLKM